MRSITDCEPGRRSHMTPCRPINTERYVKYVPLWFFIRLDFKEPGFTEATRMTRSRACAGIALKLFTGLLVPWLAVAATFSDWEASGDRKSSFLSAATVNESQEVFGEWCYPDK